MTSELSGTERSAKDTSAAGGSVRLPDLRRLTDGMSTRWLGVTGSGPHDDRPARLGPLRRAVGSGPRTIVPRQFRMFPFTKPTWPATVPREADEQTLGIAYDTDWARSPVARAARTVAVGALYKPATSWFGRTPKVMGLDRLDDVDGPVVFAANHHSHADTFVLMSTLPPRLRRTTMFTAGADYFFDTKVKAALSALFIGAVPIERRAVSRRSLAEALRLLDDGWSLVIYPEGGRSPDGWGQDHKPGAAFLAGRAKVPIVPVHIDGTDRILPKGRGRLQRAQVTVNFGLPISSIGLEDDPRRLTTLVEGAIAELADEARSDWWSARRRAAATTTPALQGPQTVSWRRGWALDASRKAREQPKRSWP